VTRFRVEEPFWALFPEARVGIVLAHGVDNRSAPGAVAERLAAAAAKAAADLGDGDVAAHAAVAPWRGAYGAFGVKPSKYRSSIESLLRSARAGRVGPINPLVDAYNAVSLEHRLPCGGEDLAAVRGDIRLTRAEGGERFVPLGAGAEDPPERGEVAYLDDDGVVCRCWNWREAERTKLTGATTDAFLCIEALPQVSKEAVGAACDALAAFVHGPLKGTARVELLDRERREIAWGPEA
jgi:DNA/RNA-binding domain of Phe-tRNA-synthetase-like protein